MKYNRKVLCFFLLVIGINYSKTNPVLVAFEVVAGAIKVFNFISDHVKSKPSPTEVLINQKQLDKLVSDITAKLDESTDNIIFAVEFQSQLSELRQVNGMIDSLLGDLKNVLQATDLDSRAHQINTYRTSYESSRVRINQINHILIGGGASSLSRSFLDLVSDHLKCSIYDLTNFENYYLRLASGGMALELGYYLFQNFSELYNTTEDRWTGDIENMVKAFDDAINKCKLKFTELATEDFKNIQNETVLTQKFRRWYADKFSDVLRISQPYVLYYQKSDPLILVDEKVGLRIAVFSEQTVAPKLTEKSVQTFKEQTQKNCKGDVNGIIHKLQDVVENLLTWNPSSLSARLYLVFDYNSNSSIDYILNIDDDSPATIIPTDCMDIKVLMYLEDTKPSTSHSGVDNGQTNDATSRFPFVLPFIAPLLVAIASCRFTFELLV